MRAGIKPPAQDRISGRDLAAEICGFFRDIVTVAVAVLFIHSFGMASFEVPTGSMEDTVKIGDRLFVNKLIYGGTTPFTVPFTSVRIPHLRVPGLRPVGRGDVVVFDWPGDRDQVEKPRQVYFLKRCLGLPGDTIRISDRVVYVNDRQVATPPRSKFLRAIILRHRPENNPLPSAKRRHLRRRGFFCCRG